MNDAKPKKLKKSKREKKLKIAPGTSIDVTLPNHRAKLKAVAIDFDNTIVEYDPDNKHMFGDVKPGARETVNSLFKEYRIIIWTCRTNTQDVADYLCTVGLCYDAININPHDSDFNPVRRKIPADLYVDDKGYHFDGNWFKASVDIRKRLGNDMVHEEFDLDKEEGGQETVDRLVNVIRDLATDNDYEFLNLTRRMLITRADAIKRYSTKIPYYPQFGLKEMFISFHRKVHRLHRWFWEGHKDESIQDSIEDTLCDTAVMALLMIAGNDIDEGRRESDY